MSYVFAGGEIADFDLVGAPTTVTTNKDAVYARAAVGCVGSAALKRSWASNPDTWLAARAEIVVTNVTLDRTLMLLSSATGDLIRLAGSATAGVLNLQRWSGSAWVTMGSTGVLGVNTGLRFTLRAKIGVAGILQGYLNTALIAEYLGDTSALGEATNLTLQSAAAASYTNYFSEVIVATQDIRSARLKTLALAGPGYTQAWTGAMADVNAYNSPDSTFLSSDTVGQVASFTQSGLAADSLNVDALFISGRVRRNTTGPDEIEALVRNAGVNYGTTFGALTSAFVSKQVVFGVNPATAAPWTRAEVTALEIGVRSKAA